MSADDVQREHARQRALLRALWRTHEGDIASLLRDTPLQARGLQAYRANASANAERALAATFPVVQALLGDEAFATLARACWRACPPHQGDMAQFAQLLPGFIASEAGLAELPYLADIARLEALLSRAEGSADAPPARGFELLAMHDPAQLRFVPAPGLAVLRSSCPVVSVWRAHQADEEAGALFEAARAALQAGRGECALVWRQGWKARVQAVDAAWAAWSEALAAQVSLGDALRAAPQGFAFEPWLLQALSAGWVLGVDVIPAGPAGEPML